MITDSVQNANTTEAEEKPNGTSKRLRRNIEEDEESKQAEKSKIKTP